MMRLTTTCPLLKVEGMDEEGNAGEVKGVREERGEKHKELLLK
jgi:hypothetical protein